MKKWFKVVVLLFFCVVFCTFFSIVALASEEIYFDDEGNLIYITYDKKATSSVSYKAIGWILKRYDAPINEPGQQYVIVRKIEYAVEDPDNPGYLYCYFWSDRDEILDAVEEKSDVWRKQLEKYGDMVYIDNVMTVCNNRVPLGNVDENGKCTGEVYYTYEGIKNARPWANKEYLKAYFDIKLRFPVLTKVPKFAYEETNCTMGVLQGGTMNSLTIGSNIYGKEEYDIEEGVPGGEKLYFLGSCDSFCYKLDYFRYTYKLYLPVEVKTKYTLKWVDLDGKALSETRTVSRWYLVPKVISFTSIDDFKIYDLQSVNVSSSLLNSEVNLYENDSGNKATIKSIEYGDVKNHIKQTSYSCSTEDVILSSEDFKKPIIPEKDYLYIAKKAVSNVYVKSDYLSLNGEVMLSNEYKNLSGCTPTKILQGQQDIYIDSVVTNELARNGWYQDFVMTCSYKERNKNTEYVSVNKNINGVKIHTPIVCKTNVYGDKSINQTEMPGLNDITLGGEFFVNFSYLGTHRDIKGYGTKNYGKYAGMTYVKFPFDVWYKGKLMNAEQWIELGDVTSSFMLPEYVKTGGYCIECKVIAKNGASEDEMGEGYNKLIEQYGAYCIEKVEVVGRIYDFTIESDDIYLAGNKDKEGKEVDREDVKWMPKSYDISEGSKVKVAIVTLGDIKDSASIMVVPRYYFLKNGESDLLEVEPCDKNEWITEYIMDSEKVIELGNNMYLWEFEYCVPDNAMVQNKEDGELLRDGVVFIAFEFRYENNGTKTILYLNEINYKNGYCNMWRRQGGCEYIDIQGELVHIKDGTALISMVGENVKDDYEVNGTH